MSILELDGRTLTYEEFRDKCLVPNAPAIIRHADEALLSSLDDSAEKFWFHRECCAASASPKGLMEVLGAEFHVPVYRPQWTIDAFTEKKRMLKALSYRACEQVPLRQILRDWSWKEKDGSGRSDYVSYLKDFHFQQHREEKLKEPPTCNKTALPFTINRETGEKSCSCLYHVPCYLGQDWLNAYWRWEQENNRPANRQSASHLFYGFGNGHNDYRFAYIGTPGSQTGLHIDVFGSYSWSLNVCGVKHWYFPSPESNACLLRNNFTGYPLPSEIRVLSETDPLLEVIQYPGDLVFVPAQYLHQVENLEGEKFSLPSELISEDGSCSTVELVMAINHNWANVYNIRIMVDLFLKDATHLLEQTTEEERTMMARLSSVGQQLNDSQFEELSWLEVFDIVLQNSTNWSFQSMLRFLHFCIEFREERGEGCPCASEGRSSGTYSIEGEWEKAQKTTLELIDRVKELQNRIEKHKTVPGC